MTRAKVTPKAHPEPASSLRESGQLPSNVVPLRPVVRLADDETDWVITWGNAEFRPSSKAGWSPLVDEDQETAEEALNMIGRCLRPALPPLAGRSLLRVSGITFDDRESAERFLGILPPLTAAEIRRRKSARRAA